MMILVTIETVFKTNLRVKNCNYSTKNKKAQQKLLGLVDKLTDHISYDIIFLIKVG